MKKHFKVLSRELERLGYACHGPNSKSLLTFEHPNGHQLLVSPSVQEGHARQSLDRAHKACGAMPAQPGNKRNTEAIKERQSAERARQRADLEAHQTRLAKLQADRDRLLAGHGRGLSGQQVRSIEAAIEQADRELQATLRLMTAVPAGADHSGRARPARHRSGDR